MRKFICFALVSIFLFNIIGYKIVFYCLEKVADVKIENRIENLSENDSDLITLRIPVNTPYQNDWNDFEKVEGEVFYNGQIYKYVKRKLQQGELILYCLNYKEKLAITENKINYLKKINESSENSNKLKYKNTKTDFFDEVSKIEFNLHLNTFFNFFTSCTKNCLNGFLGKLKLPPKPASYLRF